MLEPLSEAIEKNLLKAIGRLTTGVVNMPIRAIERRDAEKTADSNARIAELTAESNARIAIEQTLTQRLCEELDVTPEQVLLAATKYYGQIVKEQFNVDDIVKKTQLSLQNTPQDNINTDSQIGEISDDWLNQFRDAACKKSSEEAQDLFSRVLAGEIRKPGSISLRALTTLSDMDQNVAMIFKAFCSLCLVNLDNPRMYHFTQSKSNFKIKDARIPFLSGSIEDISFIRTIDHIGDNDVSRFVNMSKSIYNSFGLRLSEFQLLSEYGLIDNSSHIEYNHFWYNNELWDFLQPDVNFSQSSEDYQNITISGYALTYVGKELFHITKRHAHPQYWKLLTDYLQNLYNITLYKA